MSNNQIGIEKLKQAVKVLAEFGNVIGAVLEDGKINIADAALLPRLLGIQPVFFSLVTNPTELRNEFQNLTPDEVQQLADELRADLDIPQDKIENIIKSAADLLDVAWNLFEAIKLFSSNLKK